MGTNFNFNKVILGGRLTADPELKSTTAGVPVTSFTVAVNRRHQPKDSTGTQADFITVTAWRSAAEFVTRYFRKASSICVVGSIQTRTWTDKDNQKRYATEVVADEVYFVDSKSDGGGQAPAQAYMPEQYGQFMPQPPQFEEADTGDDLPF